MIITTISVTIHLLSGFFKTDAADVLLWYLGSDLILGANVTVRKQTNSIVIVL